MKMKHVVLLGVVTLLLAGCGDKLAPGDIEPKALALDFEFLDGSALDVASLPEQDRPGYTTEHVFGEEGFGRVYDALVRLDFLFQPIDIAAVDREGYPVEESETPQYYKVTAFVKNQSQLGYRTAHLASSFLEVDGHYIGNVIDVPFVTHMDDAISPNGSSRVTIAYPYHENPEALSIGSMSDNSTTVARWTFDKQNNPT